MEMSDLEVEEAEYQILRQILPAFITTMLKRGMLDRSRLEDVEYLWHCTREYADKKNIEQHEAIYRIDSEFIKAAKLLHENKLAEPAIVLLATLIEHRINFFYREYLEESSVSDESVTPMLRRCQLEDKISWLPELLGLDPFSNEFVSLIRSLNETRNALVHYKASPENLWTDMKPKIDGLVEKIDIPAILRMADELESFLSGIVRRKYPDIALGEEVATLMLNDRLKYLNEAIGGTL